MMRILFAKAIDGYRTAIVIDTGHGSLLGGIAFLTAFEMNTSFSPAYLSSMNLSFHWEWSKVVDNPDDFAATRGWERPPEQIMDVKLLVTS